MGKKKMTLFDTFSIAKSVGGGPPTSTDKKETPAYSTGKSGGGGLTPLPHSPPKLSKSPKWPMYEVK